MLVSYGNLISPTGRATGFVLVTGFLEALCCGCGFAVFSVVQLYWQRSVFHVDFDPGRKELTYHECLTTLC